MTSSIAWRRSSASADVLNMSELIFPLAAITVTFALIIPALSMLSALVLRAKRRRARSWSSFGSEANFALIIAPTLLPLLWLISSALHQSESADKLQICALDHVQGTTCADAIILLGALLIGSITSILVRRSRERPMLNLRYLDAQAPQVQRVRSLSAGHEHLRGLSIFVATCCPEPVFTLGLWRARVVLDACFVRDADDEMIIAALLHERAHIRGFDNLRGFIARLCLGLNPAGSLLRQELHHWRRAREAQCDALAVSDGGQPLALAQSIIRAARFRCAGLVPEHMSALCGHDELSIKLRLALLMHEPARHPRTLGHVIIALGLILVITTPHLPGAGALELFHFEVERLLHP